MKRLAVRTVLALLAAFAPAAAHMVSISTGELHVTGSEARFELKMPLYETEVLDDPQKLLFDHFSLRSGGETGRLADLSCRPDQAEGMFVCQARYEFSAPVEVLDVECRFYAVTVPNHVHILRAYRGEVADQAIFDFTLPTVTINFIPPTFWETAGQQLGAGARRALGGLAAILFLVALTVAARNRKELLALAGMFALGQALATFALPLLNWYPAPRFVEAAAALTIAYLAVEILLLPDAGQRWLVVGVLGMFHGLYLALFLRETRFSPFYLLSGAIVTDFLAIGLVALLWSRLRPRLPGIWGERIIAGTLLVFGLGWFLYRLQR